MGFGSENEATAIIQPDAPAEDSHGTTGERDFDYEDFGADARITRVIRAGLALMFAFEAAALALGIAAGASLGAVVPIHLLALLLTGAFFRFTWSESYRVRWRTALFALCVIMVVLSTAVSLITGRTTEFFVAMVLLLLGTAAIVPWGTRWQAALTLIILAAALVESKWVGRTSLNSAYQWLELLIAALLAQFIAPLAERYRILAHGGLAADATAKPTRAPDELPMIGEAAPSDSHAKSEFLSAMSHEIRAPMNAILGMADLLAETPLNDEQRKYLSIMINNGAALLDLINGILDFTRVESGNLVLEAADFDLNDLAERVAETLAIRAHQKQLELVVRIAPGVPMALVGDPLRLRQVLVNLLSNAIKFTDHGEVVLMIEGEAQGASVRLHFAVSDTGIGIAKEERERIFARYAQGDSSTARKYGGTGLGLAIVTQLVELMGGEIWVDSAVGQGSTFHFSASLSQPSAPSGARTDHHAISGARVMLIDDTEVTRATIAEILSAHGALVDQAGEYPQARMEIERAAASGSPYQVILLDGRMPGCDAADTMRDVVDVAGAGSVILMLTSDDLNLRLPLLRTMGLAHYLIKPVRRAEMLTSIEHVLGADAHSDGPAIEQVTPKSSGVGEALGATAEPAPPATITAAEPNQRCLRILVADDSADNRLLIDAFFKRAAYVTDHAENGQEAVQKFTSAKYDAVIMDIQMPVMDGYAAVREIRRWERERGARPTPIIALTASVMDEEVSQSLAAGCNTHVNKPVRRATLLDAIHEVTGYHPASREDRASARNTYVEITRVEQPGGGASVRRGAQGTSAPETANCESPHRR
ncbi:MAG: response regulator [Candidatus Binataceae bacterium]